MVKFKPSAHAKRETVPLYISYYEALGIDKNASPKDIHKAYGKFMQRHHPDKNSGIPADEQFYNVQNAYKILSDPAKREAYDTFELNASTLPSFTPHSLQPHIKQQLRTLNAHIYTLNTQTIPWFCYNRAIFLRALEQIHVKSSLFLYGFLTGNDVLLIQAFLNHTLAMLDNLQKASEIEDKFKIILNYVTAIQEDEQAQALKELYELQIDAILEAHLAIISKEAPFISSPVFTFLTSKLTVLQPCNSMDKKNKPNNNSYVRYILSVSE